MLLQRYLADNRRVRLHSSEGGRENPTCDPDFILQPASATHCSHSIGQNITGCFVSAILSQLQGPTCPPPSPVLAPSLAFGCFLASVTFSLSPDHSPPAPSLPHRPTEVPRATSQPSSAWHPLLAQLVTCPSSVFHLETELSKEMFLALMIDSASPSLVHSSIFLTCRY